jgi:hypothetical protein
MGEAIQERRRQRFIMEELDPFGKGQIGRGNDRHPFVEGRAELERQLGAGFGEGDEAQFVDDDDLLA